MGHTIGKRFTFSASHQLPGLPEGHKCGRLHGHNYRVEVVIGASGLAEPGFVTDFGDLAPPRIVSPAELPKSWGRPMVLPDQHAG